LAPGPDGTACLLFAGDRRASYNLVAGFNNEYNRPSWEYELSISGGSDDFTVSLWETGFDDLTMNVTGYLHPGDADEDANSPLYGPRFNQADVDGLQWIADHDPTDPNAIERWNFVRDPNNGSETIDANDVARMQSFVDLGLDSGIFGDINRDGRPDCGDRELIFAMFGHVLGEAEYHVELDYDLDGDNAADDLAVFHDVTCPWPLGDMNCDGSVDFGDINPFTLAQQGEAAYLAEYPNCRWLNGDINCSGAVGFADIIPFVNCVTVHHCNCMQQR
jgi:hypothetical protein